MRDGILVDRGNVFEPTEALEVGFQYMSIGRETGRIDQKSFKHIAATQ